MSTLDELRAYLARLAPGGLQAAEIRQTEALLAQCWDDLIRSCQLVVRSNGH